MNGDYINTQGGIFLIIAICDDEPEYCRQLKEYASRFLAAKKEESEIDTFGSSSDLLNQFNKKYDMVLLDIEMEKPNGIELAKKLRMDGYEGIIVFATASEQYAIEGYQVQAYRYLVKPISYEELSASIEYALKEKEKLQKMICIKINHRTECVMSNDIIYAEMFGHNMRLHLLRDNIELRASLSSIEKQLNQCFYKVHKSYIINLEYVKKFDSNSVTMINGDLIPISRNYLKEFKQRITGFWGEKING